MRGRLIHEFDLYTSKYGTSSVPLTNELQSKANLEKNPTFDWFLNPRKLI